MSPDQRTRALRLADGLSSPMGEPGVTGWATMMDAANLLRELAAEPSPWPEGLRDRIESAIERINNRHAPRRIPADPTDVDLVLAEVRALMDGKDPPFWLKRAIPQDQQDRVPMTWQPIETAPRDAMTYFLATNGSGVWVAHWNPVATSGYRFEKPWRSAMLNHWHIKDEALRHGPPTHWMPLPEPPVGITGDAK